MWSQKWGRFLFAFLLEKRIGLINIIIVKASTYLLQLLFLNILIFLFIGTFYVKLPVHTVTLSPVEIRLPLYFIFCIIVVFIFHYSKQTLLRVSTSHYKVHTICLFRNYLTWNSSTFVLTWMYFLLLKCIPTRLTIYYAREKTKVFKKLWFEYCIKACAV